MPGSLTARDGDRMDAVKARLAVICGVLAVLNVGAWLWALAAFHGRPVLLGLALIVYGLGLRHAVDADHIAAIDNVTRKLMQSGQRPVAVGFFFAFGHSTVVTVVAALVAGASTALARLQSLRETADLVGSGVSSVFLLAIAATNLVVFASLFRSYRRARAGCTVVETDAAMLSGPLARIFRPLFGLVTQSWHMLLLGVLFGLGFDTATEVAMFGVSATQLAKGVSLAAILAFPALFAAGMSLVDTTDGVLMLGAYEWAFVQPVRRLAYNMTITLMSVLVAFFIGGLEMLGLVGGVLRHEGPLWTGILSLGNDLSTVGFCIVAVFAMTWALSFLFASGERQAAQGVRERVSLSGRQCADLRGSSAGSR
jgi:high-affinity nickel-transport protein